MSYSLRIRYLADVRLGSLFLKLLSVRQHILPIIAAGKKIDKGDTGGQQEQPEKNTSSELGGVHLTARLPWGPWFDQRLSRLMPPFS